jgi:hypothetical protein
VTVPWNNSSQEVNVQGVQPPCGHHKSCDPSGLHEPSRKKEFPSGYLQLRKVQSQLFHPGSS